MIERPPQCAALGAVLATSGSGRATSGTASHAMSMAKPIVSVAAKYFTAFPYGLLSANQIGQQAAAAPPIAPIGAMGRMRILRQPTNMPSNRAMRTVGTSSIAMLATDQ